MKSDLFYYDCNLPALPVNQTLPGMKKFSYFFKIYTGGVMFLDRTGTIKAPVRTKSLYPMPALRPMPKTYEELCNERAQELLKRADDLGVRMYVFWSGGIDSTCVLVSLLKNSTPAQRDNITVVMSEDSIAENPNFYYDHLRGKIDLEPGTMAPYLFLGGDYFIVNGEHNDQLFGSDMVAKFIAKYGESYINRPYSRDVIFALFDGMTQDAAMTNLFMDTFERLRNAAPIDIATNHDFFWWINFCLKWQLVNMFVLTYASPRNAPHITNEYRQTHYAPFYNTEEFQVWSMNNLDKRIKDTWESYKWVCKDVIYDFTKDADYRDHKTKRGSRYFLLKNQFSFSHIDENMRFLKQDELAEFSQPDNDFL